MTLYKNSTETVDNYQTDKHLRASIVIQIDHYRPECNGVIHYVPFSIIIFFIANLCLHLHFLYHESWFSNGCEVVEPISFKIEVEEGLSVKPHLHNCSTQALSAEICFASACTFSNVEEYICDTFSDDHCTYHGLTSGRKTVTGLILCFCPGDKRRNYNVTPSLIGWAQT